jgi:metallo-beta-lactamase class B
MKIPGLLTLAFLSALITECIAQTEIKINDDLWLEPISKNVFVHVSVMHSEQFGRVLANGLIYIHGNEAVIMDTPPTDKQSRELLDWLKKNYADVKVKAIIVNHFHADCLGGLKAFHDEGIESWSHALSPELLKVKKDTFEVPQKTFTEFVTLHVGGKKVECYYPGEAHTRDNIVAWVEEEKVIFGGCMVKAVNAGKGNLADANVGEWSRSIERVASRYPAAKIIVPGHGAHGGMELLKFTLELFKADQR